MNSFLPFLILLLLHGPAAAQGHVGMLSMQAGIQASSQQQHLLAILQDKQARAEVTELSKVAGASKSPIQSSQEIASFPPSHSITHGYRPCGLTRDGP